MTTFVTETCRLKCFQENAKAGCSLVKWKGTIFLLSRETFVLLQQYHAMRDLIHVTPANVVHFVWKWEKHTSDDWSCAEWCLTHLLPCWHPSVWKRPHYDSVTQTWQHTHIKMLIPNLGFKNQTKGDTFTDNLTKSVFSHVYNSHISQSKVTWCLLHLFSNAYSQLPHLWPN